MRFWVGSLALLSGLRIWLCVSCAVGCRCSLDLVLLWLWRRQVATAPIRPLAWEPPYAAGVALKRTKDKKKKNLKDKYNITENDYPNFRKTKLKSMMTMGTYRRPWFKEAFATEQQQILTENPLTMAKVRHAI